LRFEKDTGSRSWKSLREAALANPYAAPFCTKFAFDARIGGNVTCSNAARLPWVR